MNVRIENSWKEALQSEFDKAYFAELVSFLHREKAEGKTIYPPGSQIFRAFELTPLDKVKVVILGQDPYHGAGQAMGLSFSVPDSVPAPPSLKNIFKEAEQDLGIRMSGRPNLESWARQGVLLLNAILTVRAGEAASHSRIGWEQFTDAVIRTVSDRCDSVVFMLWGNYARSKAPLIDSKRHLVLEAAHPSPLARGAFFGSRPFSKANAWLESRGEKAIDWQL
ncbi:MAG: uracil-DNA glycosylase [Bacteroidales bacterium]|nr:uracil-DNA glycosylase [Bacteroidales bacterium]